MPSMPMKAQNKTQGPGARTVKIPTLKPVPNDISTSNLKNRLKEVLDAANKGNDINIKRWGKDLYRIGPITILTSEERKRADKISASDFRSDMANKFSRMAQLLRPIIITLSGKEYAAIWRSNVVVAAESDLAVANKISSKMEDIMKNFRQELSRHIAEAMTQALIETMPGILHRIVRPIVVHVVKSAIKDVNDDIINNLADLVVNEIVESDRLRDEIFCLSSRF